MLKFGRKIDDIDLSWNGNFLIGKDDKQQNKKIRSYGRENSIMCTYNICKAILQEYVDVGCTHFVFSLYSFNVEKETFMEEIASSF